ncbi:MAG: lactonase family protein [Pirellulaceae bacterium]|nr:lactonase family protein [Pirellulaceae bacterium]
MIPFYIGTYTAGSSQGIYRATLDPASGQLQNLELAAHVDNPTFLTLHPTLPVLYSCSEVRRDGKRENSQLMAFRIGMHGQLTAMGGQPSGGSGPSYVATDRTGRVALVANYGSGSISSLPISADGALGPFATSIQHIGRGVDPDRQESPHAHCIMSDPSNRFACAVDLGIDQVLVYALDVARATLVPNPAGHFQAQPGTGPRHLAFHPDGQHAFIINELGNSLTAARWDAESGTFTALNTVSTLPNGVAVHNTTAEVLVHPQGRFVYGSNRGHDSLAIFEFNTETGKLSALGHVGSGGKTPRNFRLDPTGNFLLAANQDSDSIVVFRIDDQTGQLTQLHSSLQVGSPCCIKFAA